MAGQFLVENGAVVVVLVFIAGCTAATLWLATRQSRGPGAIVPAQTRASHARARHATLRAPRPTAEGSAAAQSQPPPDIPPAP